MIKVLGVIGVHAQRGPEIHIFIVNVENVAPIETPSFVQVFFY